jgi:hypothetical protein
MYREFVTADDERCSPAREPGTVSEQRSEP